MQPVFPRRSSGKSTPSLHIDAQARIDLTHFESIFEFL